MVSIAPLTSQEYADEALTRSSRAAACSCFGPIQRGLYCVGRQRTSRNYCTVNDVAVVWPPGKPPIVLAIYFTQPDKDAPSRNDVVATAAQIAAETLA